MKHLEDRRIGLCLASAAFGLLAACGSASTDSASPSSLPFEETTTSIADTLVTPESVPPGAGDPEADALGLTPEMFESMLETDSGRALLIGSMASETSLDAEAAECLLDAVPVEMLVEAAGAFLSGSSDMTGGFFSSDQMAELAPLLEDCDIAADALVP